MKKTIIALLALGSFAVAASEDFVFTAEVDGVSGDVTKVNSVALENKYDLTKDWTLNFSSMVSPLTAANEQGTSIISFGTEIESAIQIFAKVDGKQVVVKANNGGDEYTANIIENATSWGSGMEYFMSTHVFDLTYVADTNNLTLKITDGSNTALEATWQNVTFDSNATLSELSTGITPAQLNGKGAMGNLPLWTLPSGSFSGTVKASDAIPEPTTATLSLLALAGLAARRRRK